MSTITRQSDPSTGEKELDASTRLALERTQLSVTRSSLASERILDPNLTIDDQLRFHDLQVLDTCVI